MNQFLLGVLTTLAMTIAMFFLRFWRGTRDRLFVLFSAAFFLLGAQWLALAFVTLEKGSEHVLYGVRLLAFGVIIVAVVDKNRSRR